MCLPQPKAQSLPWQAGLPQLLSRAQNWLSAPDAVAPSRQEGIVEDPNLETTKLIFGY